MTHKIFQSPPLGEMTPSFLRKGAGKKSAHIREDQIGAISMHDVAKTSKRGSVLPVPAAYRVEPIARMITGGSKWRTEAMRSHRTPTLLWFTRGQGRITVTGVTRGFGAHNLVYLPPRTMYGFETVGQVYGYAVHLPDSPELDFPEAPLHMRFREVTQQNEITGLIENLASEIDHDQPERARAMALKAGLISVWLTRQVQIMPEYDLTPDASRRLTAAFTAQVERDFRTEHSVTHYAASLGVTTTHLTRACNVACARSASAIVADRVHFEARRLLKETDLPINVIAARLGFQSPSYFTRAFSKQTGTSPRAFRNAP